MPKKFMDRLPRIAIAVSTNQLVQRDIIAGILRYVSLHTPWVLSLAGGRSDEPDPLLFSRERCDGIFTDDSFPSLVEIAERNRIPVVAVQTVRESPAIVARIEADHTLLAELVAAHLVEGGFTRFAYVGERSGSWWSADRAAKFAQALAARGFAAETYAPPPGCQADDRDELARWLAAMPKPVALLAANDARAREIAEACHLAKIRAPGDVAIVGVDNDEILCSTVQPRLSSVSWTCAETGYAAAKFLEGILRGARRPAEPVRFNFTARDLIVRESSVGCDSRDELVTAVREFIEANLAGGLTASTVAASLGISARTLSQRFQQATGHTIHSEILSLRLARAKRLLCDRTLTQEYVASSCGFYDVSHLRKMLKSKCSFQLKRS